MTFRRKQITLVVLVSLSLGGCSATPDADSGPASSEGTIELAVSETCTEGSDPRCILVGGEYVVRPASFEQAPVEDVAVSDSRQQNAVDVIFTAEGAAVLSDLTERSAQAGDDSRLLLRVGDEILAAVVVMEALDSGQLTIALSPDDDPREFVDLLRLT